MGRSCVIAFPAGASVTGTASALAHLRVVTCAGSHRAHGRLFGTPVLGADGNLLLGMIGRSSHQVRPAETLSGQIPLLIFNRVPAAGYLAAAPSAGPPRDPGRLRLRSPNLQKGIRDPHASCHLPDDLQHSDEFRRLMVPLASFLMADYPTIDGYGQECNMMSCRQNRIRIVLSGRCDIFVDEAAIDTKCCAGDVVSIIRGQERGRLSNVCRRSHAAPR